jgi:hypothetical protein
MSNEEYQKKYEQLDEDRADIVAYLKKLLQEREGDITELRERLAGVQKVRDNSFLYNDLWFVPSYFYHNYYNNYTKLRFQCTCIFVVNLLRSSHLFNHMHRICNFG